MRWMRLVGVLALVLLTACGGSRPERMPPEPEFTIRLTGTELVDVPLPSGGVGRVHHPVTFTLTVTVTQANGKSTTNTVDGFVPDTYAARGVAVSASATKTQASGTLAITLVKGESIVASQETTSEYGTVTV